MTIARITLPELEQYLAKAADLLRGSIDQADFKAYIFPLLFFKRISDVYDEEYAPGAGGVRRRPRVRRASPRTTASRSPRAASGATCASRTENVGQALQNAIREIEKANPDTLYGIFGDANWTNKDRLPDRMLLDLIEHFSTKTLVQRGRARRTCSGNAYEYLIKRFADQSNKKAGEFYTPRSVVGLMVNILDPARGRDASTTRPAAPAAC